MTSQYTSQDRPFSETTGMSTRESGSESNLPHAKHVLFTPFTRRHKHYAGGFGPMVFLPGVDNARVFTVGYEYKIEIGALIETSQDEASAQQS